jgi:hypothetical protein
MKGWQKEMPLRSGGAAPKRNPPIEGVVWTQEIVDGLAFDLSWPVEHGPEVHL